MNCYADPILGEIRKARDLGFVSSHGTGAYKYVECSKCHERRWVQRSQKLKTSLCRKCFELVCGEHLPHQLKGVHSPAYKGGTIGTGQGYVQRRLFPDNFFYSMANKSGYILEHRYVMASHLGRCLHRWEVVHHKNHIRNDNRIENLQLVSDDRHTQITLLENRIALLEKRVITLESENVLLRNGL